MKISTLGSCYSRYVANQLAMFTNSKIISCTYHNRSDFFIEKFFDDKHNDEFYNSLIDALSSPSTDSTHVDPDSNIINILRNQTREYSGSHRLASGSKLIDCIEYTDVFIFDNYMDISAKLFLSDNEEVVFFNSRDPMVKKHLIDRAHVSLNKVTSLLGAQDSYNNFSTLINSIKKKKPNSFVVYLNFPFNTYSDSPDKVALIRENEKLSNDLNADLIMPSLNVPKAFQTHQKQHFKTAFYSYVAGRIVECLNFKLASKNKVL